MSKSNGNGKSSIPTVDDDLSHLPEIDLSPEGSKEADTETIEPPIEATFEEGDPLVATSNDTGDIYGLLRSSLLSVTGELRSNLPTTPLKSAAEIGQELGGISDRAVQKKFDSVLKAFPWIPVEEMRQGTSNYTRYTPLGQYLIQHQHKALNSQREWVEKCLELFADKVQAEPQQQQQQQQQPLQQVDPTATTESDDTSPSSALALPVEQGEFVDEILGQIAQRNSGTSLSLELGQAIISNKAAKTDDQLSLLLQLLQQQQSNSSQASALQIEQWKEQARALALQKVAIQTQVMQETEDALKLLLLQQNSGATAPKPDGESQSPPSS